LDESPRTNGRYFAASTNSHPSNVNRWYQVFVAKYDKGTSTHSTPNPPKHGATSSSFGPKNIPANSIGPNHFSTSACIDTNKRIGGLLF
jgi:hypothetical protein